MIHQMQQVWKHLRSWITSCIKSWLSSQKLVNHSVDFVQNVWDLWLGQNLHRGWGLVLTSHLIPLLPARFKRTSELKGTVSTKVGPILLVSEKTDFLSSRFLRRERKTTAKHAAFSTKKIDMKHFLLPIRCFYTPALKYLHLYIYIYI